MTFSVALYDGESGPADRNQQLIVSAVDSFLLTQAATGILETRTRFRRIFWSPDQIPASTVLAILSESAPELPEERGIVDSWRLSGNHLSTATRQHQPERQAAVRLSKAVAHLP
jgi:hypothetical protein